MDYRQFIHDFQPGDILLEKLGELEMYFIYVYLGDKVVHNNVKCKCQYIGDVGFQYYNSVKMFKNVIISEYLTEYLNIFALEKMPPNILLKFSMEYNKDREFYNNLLSKHNITPKLINIRKNSIDELLDYYEKF